MPKVSVIMGVYNTNNEQMLRQSIDSVLSQTFSDFEFIICDDGSTDGTDDLLEKICIADKRIILIKNEHNIGLAATLNRCIDISTGEYIARQDADDYSLPERFETQVKFLEKNEGFGFAGCNVNYFNDMGKWGKSKQKEHPYKRDFLFVSPFIHPTVVFRRNALLESKCYRIAPETRRAEDYDLFMSMYAKGFTGGNLEEILYCYREDEKSYKRRKYKYRIDEAIVRYKGFKKLELLPKGYIYIIKPLIVGLIPVKLLELLKNYFYKRKQ